jgi:peptide/nickel transport system permease protein
MTTFLVTRLILSVPALSLLVHPKDSVSGALGSAGAVTALLTWFALLVGLAVWRGPVARTLATWFARLVEPTARMGLLLVLLLHTAAVFAPLLTADEPSQLGDTVTERYLPPSREHWMGTDLLGRDLYSRVLYGARVSLAVATLSVFLSVVIGTAVGAAAGWTGGLTDGALMRITDLVLAFPRIFLVLLLAAMTQPDPMWIVLVLGATGWMGVARLVRGSVLQIREQDYVLAARAVGLAPLRLLWRHVLPAAVAPIVAAAALRVGNTILAESFLSFLGLGITDPNVSWGMLIRGGRHTMLDAWWVSTYPGLAIVITVVGYNLLGDGLRDAYDRRLGELGPRED